MIGIIGGIGPAAGADLLKKIIEETNAAKDQEHLPVILFSLPHQIEDRTAFLTGKIPKNPGLAIAQLCGQMEELGVTLVGIPCNTAHAPQIFDTIGEKLKEKGSNIKLVHLINENVAYLRSNFKEGTRIGVLSTTGTYEQKIYSSKITAAGYKCIVPKEDIQQELVHNAIYHYSYGIKSNISQITGVAKSLLYHVMDLMKADGVEAIILGCTEIPLAIAESEYQNMKLIDATRILARALIREYDESKLKNNDSGCVGNQKAANSLVDASSAF